MNLDQVTVTITPETGAPLVVNTTDAEAAFLGDLPSAVRTMTATWQQPNGRDHATAGGLDLELILDTPTHPAIGYEARVDVQIALAGRDPIPLWRGWINEITVARRTVRHPDTRQKVTTWAWALAVDDVIARAAATRVNLPPDLTTAVFDSIVLRTTGRIHAIDNAAPIRLVDPAVFNGLFVNMNSLGSDQTAQRPRDVDNQNVLDLIQTIANGGALQVHDGPNGLVLRYCMPGVRRLVWVLLQNKIDNPIIPSLNRPNQLAAGPIEQGPAGNRLAKITTLPASLVEETPRELNRGTVLNEVAIRYWVSHWVSGTYPDSVYSDPEERTVYLRNTTRQASTAQHTLASDIWLTKTRETDPEPVLDNTQTATAQSWLELSAIPHRTIHTVDMVAGAVDLDPASVEPLINLADRGIHGLILTEAPEDLDTTWRVLGGQLAIVQGRIDSLTFTVESTRLTGQLPITWDDVPRATTAQFTDGQSVLVTPTFNLTSRALKYDGLAMVSTANHHLYV